MKSVMDRIVTIGQCRCVGAMIAPVYGTVEKNRQGNLVILCSLSVSIVCLGGVLEKSTVLKRFADNSK